MWVAAEYYVSIYLHMAIKFFKAPIFAFTIDREKYPIQVYSTSGKNHFHEMNGDVGMAGWK